MQLRSRKDHQALAGNTLWAAMQAPTQNSLVNNFAKEEGNAPSENYSLLWPLLALVLTVCAVLVVQKFYFGEIDKFFAASKRRRAAAVFVLLLFGAVIAVLLDIVDVASLKDGATDWMGCILLTIAVCLGVVWFWLQLVTFLHGDEWDNRIREADRRVSAAEEESRIAIASRDFVLSVMNTFLQIVQIKAEKMRKWLAEGQAPLQSLSELKAIVEPNDQIRELVLATYHFFKTELGVGKSLRVALFVERDKVLQPMACWNGVTSECLVSPCKHREKFNVDAINDCLAVWAYRHGKIVEIEDADAAGSDGSSPFNFFESGQRGRIQSMLALPIIGHLSTVHAVFCIDTDQRGFFQRAKSDRYELLRKNLAHRVLLEMDLDRLFG